MQALAGTTKGNSYPRIWQPSREAAQLCLCRREDLRCVLAKRSKRVPGETTPVSLTIPHPRAAQGWEVRSTV